MSLVHALQNMPQTDGNLASIDKQTRLIVLYSVMLLIHKNLANNLL